MDKRFLTAFIAPSEWEIVGYKLKPYSVRKHINLLAVDSPYINGQVPTAMETIQFLKYCSSDCESIINVPSVNLFDMVAYAKIRYQPQFHAYVIRSIVNYIKEYSSGPNYRIVKKKNSALSETLVNNSGIPDMLFLISACMNKLGLSEKDAMNLSIGKIGWYSAAISALDGSDVRLTQEEEDASSEMLKLIEWEKEQAEKLRLAMVNGKIPKKRIKLASEQ